MSKKKGRQITIYLDDEVRKIIQDKADEERRSFSSMLNIFLREKLKLEVKK